MFSMAIGLGLSNYYGQVYPLFNIFCLKGPIIWQLEL